MSFIEYFDSKPRSFFIGAGTVAALLIGVPDYLLGYGVSFSIFYLVPISIAAWYAGKGTGIYVAVISAAIWFTADELSGNPFVLPYVPVWNAVVRLGFFLILVYLLDAFKREKTYAREDYLTGLGNRRYFFERADAEIKRSQRYGHALTVAYIDIDHFKAINDRFGHTEGDALLRSVAKLIKSNIRATDLDARLGGDEFAVLLPESNAKSAEKFFAKLHRLLSRIIVHDGGPVTFSIGVVTFLKPPKSIDAMIKTVDRRMYAAKESGKNMVKYSVIDTEQE